MKGSVDVSLLDEYGLGTYLAVCSICLARAHARSGDAAAISGYLGQGKAFEEAIADFATAYADQTERDYQALVDAVKSGCIAAETGI
jgi:predicted alpha/beta hydrolase